MPDYSPWQTVIASGIAACTLDTPFRVIRNRQYLLEPEGSILSIAKRYNESHPHIGWFRSLPTDLIPFLFPALDEKIIAMIYHIESETTGNAILALYQIAKIAVTFPLNVVSIRMMADADCKYANPVACVQNIVKTEGIGALYRPTPLFVVHAILSNVLGYVGMKICGWVENNILAAMFPSSWLKYVEIWRHEIVMIAVNCLLNPIDIGITWLAVGQDAPADIANVNGCLSQVIPFVRLLIQRGDVTAGLPMKLIEGALMILITTMLRKPYKKKPKEE